MRTLFVNIVLLVFILTGCQPILKSLIGLKKPKALTSSKIHDLGVKYGIPESSIYQIDTALFWATLQVIGDSSTQKDWYQPLQVKAFDNLGNSHFHLINCNIGGFPNVDWNRFNTFRQYPLDLGKLKRVDTSLTLNAELEMVIPVKESANNSNSQEANDEILIIYWNRMMQKQSKRLVETVLAYQSIHDSLKIKAYYVNTDNVFMRD